MKALVIGDSCIDEYVYCEINRVNPEAPVPLLDVLSVQQKMGMVHNVARNLSSFGVDVFVEAPSGNISKKIRYIDKKSNRILMRADHDVRSDRYKHKRLDGYDFIVISDYNKGFLDHEDILKIRRSFLGPIYLDTKKKVLDLFQDIYIKINEKEFNDALSLPADNRLIITYGSAGCSYNKKSYDAVRTEVMDVCGAGDTFLAAMAYTHAKTRDMDKALKIANHCASIACSHMGVYALSPEDVKCVFS